MTIMRTISTSDDELKERIRNREQRRQEALEFRSTKLDRVRYKGAGDDVELANAFRMIGIDYSSIPHEQAFKIVPVRLEGHRVSQFEPKALDFLHENFNVVHVQDEEGRTLLHFTQPTADKEQQQMKMINAIAEEVGEKRKRVNSFYEALLKVVRHELRDAGKLQLPGFGRISLKYRPAVEERPGINPFTRAKMTFKARPASSVIRFTPAKELKEYIAEKVAPTPPPGKEKKGKEKESKKEKTHHHSKH